MAVLAAVLQKIRVALVKSPDQLLDFAKEVVQAAGELTSQYFRSADLAVEFKGDGSPVTVADRGAETLIRDAIAQEFPNDSILGEEHGEAPGDGSGRQWVIDPIDGTKAFTAGVPLYSNLLAVVDDGVPVLGIANFPGLTEMLWATKGGGAYCNGQRCQVNSHSRVAGAFVMTSSFTYWPAGAIEQLIEAKALVRTWGDAYGYNLVATGRASAMVDPSASIWDIAPVALIVDEAGGRFSDRKGTDHIHGQSGVATNAKIHDEILAVL